MRCNFIYVLALATLLIGCGGGGGGGGNSTTSNPAPAAPTGIVVVAGNSQLDISWNEVAGASSYNIYRSTSAGSRGAKVGASSSTTYTDTTVANGTTYYYTVTADNSAGEGPPSSQSVGATPSVPFVTPTAPTGVNTIAGNAQVVVTWAAVSTATSYNIYRSTSPGSQGAKVGASSSTTYTDTTAANGTTYYYTVTADNSAGEGPPSNQSGGATPAAPVVVPTAPTGVIATAGNAQVVVTWTTVSTATSYNIYRSTSAGVQGMKVGSSATAPYTDTTAANGTTYYYEVTGTDAGGEGPASTQTDAVTPAKPYTPPNVTTVFTITGGSAASPTTVINAPNGDSFAFFDPVGLSSPNLQGTLTTAAGQSITAFLDTSGLPFKLVDNKSGNFLLFHLRADGTGIEFLLFNQSGTFLEGYALVAVNGTWNVATILGIPPGASIVVTDPQNVSGFDACVYGPLSPISPNLVALLAPIVAVAVPASEKILEQPIKPSDLTTYNGAQLKTGVTLMVVGALVGGPADPLGFVLMAGGAILMWEGHGGLNVNLDAITTAFSGEVINDEDAGQGIFPAINNTENNVGQDGEASLQPFAGPAVGSATATIGNLQNLPDSESDPSDPIVTLASTTVDSSVPIDQVDACSISVSASVSQYNGPYPNCSVGTETDVFLTNNSDQTALCSVFFSADPGSDGSVTVSPGQTFGGAGGGLYSCDAGAVSYACVPNQAYEAGICPLPTQSSSALKSFLKGLPTARGALKLSP